MKKKYIKIALGIIVLVLIGLMLNPFYWLMQPKERPKQPELSKEEVIFFKKLKATYNCDLERFYYNYTSKGEDTLFEKNYTKVPFKYSLSLDLQEGSNFLSDDSIYAIALDIKNKILKNNSSLKEIIIYRNYKNYKYLYDLKKDSLILQH